MSILLVVEDNPATLHLLKSAFSDRHTVQTATNGVEALGCVEEKRPDLIISDVMMPKMDGWSFHRALRDDKGHHDIPFIFLTAKAKIGDQELEKCSDADHFVSKPFSIQDLGNKVESLLE